MTTPSGSTPVLFKNFHYSQQYFQQMVNKKDLTDLHSYKNIFGQRGLVYHKK